MRTSIILFFLFFQQLLSAQTYFYINGLEVIPANPTTADVITLNIHGDLSSSGAYITNVDFTISGTDVLVTIDAADPGGLAVLVPHTESIELGQLAAGTYTIIVSGANVLDMAPVPDHTFIVSAGGVTSCDSLEIVSIQYHAFNDTLISVSLLNSGSDIFSYPGFILFNAEGDTIAIETVDLFGIGPESTHRMVIHDDADLTDPSFSGTLELWTDFYDTLACTFPVTVALCPATCATIIPYVMNQGGATVTASFNYMIIDQGSVVHTGAFELNEDQQYDADTICLIPGSYTMDLIGGPVAGGQTVFGVSAPGGIDGPQAPLNPTFLPEFDFYASCVDIGQAIGPIAEDQPITVSMDGQHIQIERTDGEALNEIFLIDARGRTIGSFNTNANLHAISLEGLTTGVYLIRIATGSEVPFVHKFAHIR